MKQRDLTDCQKWAHATVKTAVEAGRLHRQPCESCGLPRAQAHHDDYFAPLVVRWLCRSCHRTWHVTNTPANIDAIPPRTERGLAISESLRMGGFMWRGKLRKPRKVS